MGAVQELNSLDLSMLGGQHSGPASDWIAEAFARGFTV
jgi:hypothetical protein